MKHLSLVTLLVLVGVGYAMAIGLITGSVSPLKASIVAKNDVCPPPDFLGPVQVIFKGLGCFGKPQYSEFVLPVRPDNCVITSCSAAGLLSQVLTNNCTEFTQSITYSVGICVNDELSNTSTTYLCSVDEAWRHTMSRPAQTEPIYSSEARECPSPNNCSTDFISLNVYNDTNCAPDSILRSIAFGAPSSSLDTCYYIPELGTNVVFECDESFFFEKYYQYSCCGEPYLVVNATKSCSTGFGSAPDPVRYTCGPLQ
jgi:hypothetical protein